MSKATSLKVYEWLAILSLIVLLTSLALMACLAKSPLTSTNSHPLNHQIHQSQGKIEIVVKGHVNKPGVYTVPSNTTMKDMLSMAEVCPGADLRRFRMDRPIKRSRLINIKMRPIIQVHLKGAVKSPGPLSIPKGSTLEDLISLADLSEKANLESLKKKRRLNNDETIIIPEEKCCAK